MYSAMALTPSLLVLTLSLFPLSSAADFWFSKFDGNARQNLTFWNDAQISVEWNKLQLNNLATNRSGRVLYSSPLKICPNGNATSFYTNFTFDISGEGALHGDGFAIFLTPIFQGSPNGSFGKFFGLLNESQNSNSSGDFVAVEFDTYMNEFDNDSHHIGVDVNNVYSIKAVNLDDVGLQLTEQKITCWVDYTIEPSKKFSICASTSSSCQKPFLEVEVDLCGVLRSEDLYMGFSAGTQGGYEYHDIFSWGFSFGTRTSSSAHRSYKSLIISLVVAALVIILVCAGLVLWIKSRKKLLLGSYNFESTYAPQIYSYGQLKKATNGFQQESILGSGGYGTVYRGTLSDKSVVAVKCIRNRTEEGEKTFLSEASIVGRLSHRNLVRLRGWCEQRRELFLVYDCMPHGSLDNFLFKDSSLSHLLTWDTRFNIICDLANALHYLHLECPHPIVHRDIKCSNILLDTGFLAKLGDFGLARSIDISAESFTTTLGGTIGYLAPELVESRKPSPATDMYSFGVVVLEIVSGKRALAVKGKDVEVLLEWMEQLREQGRLPDVVDPKLERSFVATEVQLLVTIGSSCVCDDPQKRMDISQAVKLLRLIRQDKIMQVEGC